MCQVRTLPQRCDVYDDVATGALRELCLNFYDARAIVVEVCRRADHLSNSLAGAEQWQRQLAALEALQIFAPMGHALGLASVSAELEDRCFQVHTAAHSPYISTVTCSDHNPPWPPFCLIYLHLQ